MTTAVTGFKEPFVDTRPFYRGTYFQVVTRTATGAGNGASSVAHGASQTRLGQLTDFSFPYLTGGRFYLGVRAVLTVTATASGLGTASSSANVLRQRQGTGSGTGSQTATGILVAVRTATGSGVGTMDSTGLHIAPRTATGSGTGTETADWTKSHIFRVGITSDYSFAARYPETDSDRLFAHTPQGIRAYNLYKLTNNTYQITDPRRPELVSKIYYGGHDIFLDDTEVAELTAAGYGANIT